MTTLEEMQQAWQSLDRKLERLERNEQLRRIRSPLRRLLLQLSLEVAVATVALLFLGTFLADHVTKAGLLWPAAVLDLWLIGSLAAAVRQLIAARQIDFASPVAEVQRQLSELRFQRFRALRWQLLTGQIAWWLPFAILTLHLAGVDAYRVFSTTFLAVNLGLGIAAIPLAIWAAKRWGARLSHTRLLRRLADEIAGRSLTEAQRYAAALADFERG